MWEQRGRSFYLIGLADDYLVGADEAGWRLSRKAHGDQRWSLVGYYPSAGAAKAAAEEIAPTSV